MQILKYLLIGYVLYTKFKKGGDENIVPGEREERKERGVPGPIEYVGTPPNTGGVPTYSIGPGEVRTR